jgi:hypothetical protein
MSRLSREDLEEGIVLRLVVRDYTVASPCWVIQRQSKSSKFIDLLTEHTSGCWSC